MASTSPRYDDLTALFINCTLKPSPELSHTQGLVVASAGIMAEQGARTEIVRAVDHDIATGVWPDMTEHGAATDAWPRLYPKVLATDILGSNVFNLAALIGLGAVVAGLRSGCAHTEGWPDATST